MGESFLQWPNSKRLGGLSTSALTAIEPRHASATATAMARLIRAQQQVHVLPPLSLLLLLLPRRTSSDEAL